MIAGEKIKRERIKRGLSQEELGDLLDVTKVSVCGYETGTRTPTVHTLEKLTEVLGLSPNELLDYSVYAVSEEQVSYDVKVSKEEVAIIHELRKYPSLYEDILEDPNKKIKEIEKLLTNNL